MVYTRVSDKLEKIGSDSHGQKTSFTYELGKKNLQFKIIIFLLL